MLDDIESEMRAAFLSEAQSLLEDAENAFMALDAFKAFIGGLHSDPD